MIAHLDFLEGAAGRARRLILAGVFVLALHAGAGALALVHWDEDDATDEDAGAFLVELAPMAAAPPTEKLNLAIGQRAEEAAAAVAPTEEVKEMSEVETPEIAEAPLAPEPEVVVEKKKPLEELEVKEEEEEPRPEQKAIPTVSAASQETAAPPPVEAPLADKPVAPKQGVSSKPSEAVMSWQKSLVFHLNKHKKYPSDARRRGEEGVVQVSFSVDRSGKVIDARLEGSSGSQLLDEEAIEVLSRASPFPAPPSDMTGVSVHLTLPIQFRIRR